MKNVEMDVVHILDYVMVVLKDILDFIVKILVNKNVFMDVNKQIKVIVIQMTKKEKKI